ncbi:ABC-2 type transport system permease protein [Arthrobacter ginsengisoli]|uniref:ABC-2 type transport system permease protein n=1 Tax=Arthrobacter ginsengisoli TaxID=1356565 RepID=A0ABU1UA65_9MICC|nr:ABC transporter permease [Arthrobacter ginsengisoli]MDR7082077.1 ABC-2 type transport system permease protein [Arthrobacter ginsengisoli]
MVGNDLRQRIRDKSVVIFSLIVPLALMGVLSLVFGGVGEDTVELRPATVIASADDADQLGAALLGTVDSLEILDVTIRRVPSADVRTETRASGAELGIIIPEGFSNAVLSGQAVSVQLVEGNGATLETSVLITVVQGIVDQFAAGTVTAAAGGMSGLPPQELAALAQQASAGPPLLTVTEGRAAAEQLSLRGTLVAGQAGLFLMFTVGFGVLGLLAEREQGTLARLRSMPVTGGAVITAKACTGFILGVAATTVLLAVGSRLFGVSFGSPPVVAALILSVVTAATSLTFVVARLVRTAEQANVAQSILAMVLGIAGGAFFPVQGTGFAATLLDLNPIGAFIRGLGISAGGGSLTDIAGPVAVMLAFAAAGLLLSRLLPNRGAQV